MGASFKYTLDGLPLSSNRTTDYKYSVDGQALLSGAGSLQVSSLDVLATSFVNTNPSMIQNVTANLIAVAQTSTQPNLSVSGNVNILSASTMQGNAALKVSSYVTAQGTCILLTQPSHLLVSKLTAVGVGYVGSNISSLLMSGDVSLVGIALITALPPLDIIKLVNYINQRAGNNNYMMSQQQLNGYYVTFIWRSK